MKIGIVKVEIYIDWSFSLKDKRNEVSHIDQMMDKLIDFIEGNTKGEVLDIAREIINY